MKFHQLLLLFAVSFVLFSPVVFAGTAGEFFLAAPPKEWLLGSDDKQIDIATFEFVPLGQSVDRWTELVTIQKRIGLTEVTPDQFLADMAKENESVCDGYAIRRLAFQDKNGYETHGMIQSCGTNKDSKKGELTIIRVVRGEDNFYSISRAWRLEPFDAEGGLPLPKNIIDDTIKYLATVTVCDTRKGTCPQGMGK